MNAYTWTMGTAPWYRQRWPWLLMLGPAVVIVAGIATVWLAIASDDGLVADDYYRQGLAINRTIERNAQAEALGLAARVDVEADGRVRVVLESAVPAAAAFPSSLRLVLAHPTRAGGDVTARLSRAPTGDYVGTIAPPAPGRWRVIVEAERWRLPPAEVDGAVRGVRVGSPRR